MDHVSKIVSEKARKDIYVMMGKSLIWCGEKKYKNEFCTLYK